MICIGGSDGTKLKFGLCQVFVHAVNYQKLNNKLSYYYSLPSEVTQW